MERRSISCEMHVTRKWLSASNLTHSPLIQPHNTVEASFNFLKTVDIQWKPQGVQRHPIHFLAYKFHFPFNYYVLANQKVFQAKTQSSAEINSDILLSSTLQPYANNHKTSENMCQIESVYRESVSAIRQQQHSESLLCIVIVSNNRLYSI